MSLDVHNATNQLGSWKTWRLFYGHRPFLVLLVVCFSATLISYLWVHWVSLEGNLSAGSLSPISDPLEATVFANSCISSPAGPSYSAVILYLAAVDRRDSIIKSLSTVFHNMPLTFPWPIILFHPGDYDNPDDRNSLKAGLLDKIGYEADALAFLTRIEFERLYWKLPAGIPSDVDALDPIYRHVWPGYHHMCAFYTYQIFDHPRLRNVTYYLRLDTDSFILDPICYDPIERAHSHALSYAYVAASTDDPWLTEGLWKLVDSYATRIEGIDERMKANGFVWPDGRGVPEMMAESKFPTIYNNFEIVRLERFRQPDIQGWLKEVSSVPERFYKYRWGDAPLRYATIYMFLDMETEVEQFCGMRYEHLLVWEPQCPCVAD